MCRVSFACVTMLVMSSLYVLAHMEYGPGFDNPGPTCFGDSIYPCRFLGVQIWPTRIWWGRIISGSFSKSNQFNIWWEQFQHTSWLNWLTWPIAEVLNVQNRRPATPIRDGRHILKGGWTWCRSLLAHEHQYSPVDHLTDWLFDLP